MGPGGGLPRAADAGRGPAGAGTTGPAAVPRGRARGGRGGRGGRARGGPLTLMISASVSRLPILSVIILRNSSNSIWPDPSLSMSEIIFLMSSLEGSKPRARMATCGDRGGVRRRCRAATAPVPGPGARARGVRGTHPQRGRRCAPLGPDRGPGPPLGASILPRGAGRGGTDEASQLWLPPPIGPGDCAAPNGRDPEGRARTACNIGIFRPDTPHLSRSAPRRPRGARISKVESGFSP